MYILVLWRRKEEGTIGDPHSRFEIPLIPCNYASNRPTVSLTCCIPYPLHFIPLIGIKRLVVLVNFLFYVFQLALCAIRVSPCPLWIEPIGKRGGE